MEFTLVQNSFTVLTFIPFNLGGGRGRRTKKFSSQVYMELVDRDTLGEVSEKGGAGSGHFFQGPPEREGARRPATFPYPVSQALQGLAVPPSFLAALSCLYPQEISLFPSSPLSTSPASQTDLIWSPSLFFCCVLN